MKRVLLLLFIVLTGATAFAQDGDIAVGLEVPFWRWAESDDVGSTSITWVNSTTGITAFVDLVYGEFSVGYHSTYGDWTVMVETPLGSSEQEADFSKSFLHIGAAAKAPGEIGNGFTFFLGLTLDYYQNLTAVDNENDLTKGDYTDDEKREFNELFVGLSGDLDYDVTESIFLRLGVGIGYNLLAREQAAADLSDDYSAFGMRVGINLGGGYRL
jgi:opacity protein-like surface antigen